MLLGSHKVEQTRITEAVKSSFKARQSSNGFTVKTHMWGDAPLIVQDARIVAALLIAPESIRRDLCLRVRILGTVKESIVCLEAVHA